MMKGMKISDMLAEELSEIVTNTKQLKSLVSSLHESEATLRRNLNEIEKLKQRIAMLERRVDKNVRRDAINAIEAGRYVSERAELLVGENSRLEQRVANLATEIEDLRTAMVRLSNKVRQQA